MKILIHLFQRHKLRKEGLRALGYLSLTAVLMCLSSCSLLPPQITVLTPQAPVVEKTIRITVPDTRTQDSHIYEAKWSDIPFVLDAQRDRAQESSDHRGCVFVYTTSLSLDECLDFYHAEMERLGWIQGTVLSFAPEESIALYEKPNKQVVVFFQADAHATHVRLYIGVKEKGHVETVPF